MRKQVEWFGEQMEAKLKVHDAKGGWDKCDLYWLLDRLRDEVNELKYSLDAYCSLIGEKTEVVHEAADVANFAMMIADNINKKSQ